MYSKILLQHVWIKTDGLSQGVPVDVGLQSLVRSLENKRCVLTQRILRFPVKRNTTQISTQSFEVKLLTFPMATRMYSMQAMRVKSFSAGVSWLCFPLLSIMLCFSDSSNIKHGISS